MKFYQKTILATALAVLMPSLSSATDKDPKHLMTCKKLDYILIHHPANDIRPYCNKAEIYCRLMPLVKERPKKDKLRRKVEKRLKRDTRFELNMCEVAIRKLDPNYLTER